MDTEAATAELYLRDIQHAAGMVLAELAMDTSVPTVSWGVHSLYRDDAMFPTLEGQAKSLAEVEAYAALWDVPVTDRFAGTQFEGTSFQVVAVLRGIHVRVWVSLSDEETRHRRVIAEEAEREAEEAAADWAQGVEAEDADTAAELYVEDVEGRADLAEQAAVSTTIVEQQIAMARAVRTRSDALCLDGGDWAFLWGYMRGAAPERAMRALEALEKKRAEEADLCSACTGDHDRVGREDAPDCWDAIH